MNPTSIETLPLAPQALGESPVWHPQEQALYWVDIPGHCLHRWDWQRASHRSWPLEDEPGCVAPVDGGGLVLAMRQGIVRLDPETSRQWTLATAPYDPTFERFNDGKVAPDGSLWVGTIYEPRDQARATLFRLGPQGLQPVWSQCTVSNGLAWSPDGAHVYWSDTWGHTLYRTTLDTQGSWPATPQVWKRFSTKDQATPDQAYGGRPDGGAVDSLGRYWSAMFEGGRLLVSDAATGSEHSFTLPVQCPTMPCFAGPDLRTLVVTTARYQRSDDELARTPWAGQLLCMPAPVAGTCPPLLNPLTLPTP